MHVFPINPIRQNKINYTKAPSFRSDMSFDIGGSQREGSCKILYTTSDGAREIIKLDTTVNDSGELAFKNSDDFIEHIVKKIRSVQQDGRYIVQYMGYDNDENALRNIAIFLPSYTSDNNAYYLPNHMDTKGKPLKDLDFRNLKARLEEKGVELAPGMKFRIMQDALGTGLAMTQRLYDYGMLEEGKYYTAVITGGGCGVANIEVPDSEKVIVKSTGSRYFVQGNEMKKVSKEGASAPAFIRNFCRRMRMNDELVEDIVSCHKAEFTTSEKCILPKDVKTEKLANLLAESGMFETDLSDPQYVSIKVKSQYESRFDAARRSAIDRYCYALAGLAAIKKNEGSNGLIITGKFAHAIDNTAKKYYTTDPQKPMGLARWIRGHLSNAYDTYELEKIHDVAYGFEVICDKRFFIENNTECGKLAHLAEFVNPTRGNWLKVPIKHLAR